SANDTHYLHTDHLGSVEATTNALGQFVNRMSFGAWGERQKSDWRPGTPTESFITSNGFTGHDQLDNHNLVHMGGRVYDPNLGRFLSADLFIQSPYDSQNYNRYSYVGNNPLSYTDPTGYKRSNLDPAQRGFAFAMQQATQQSIPEICCSYARSAQREFAEWYHNYTERARGFFMGQDYSGNSFQQNVVLCQGGAGGACSTATDQGRQLYPDNAFAQVVDLGESMEDLGKVAAFGATAGIGGGANAVRAANAANAERVANAKKAADALSLRQAYVSKVNSLAQKAAEMKKAGVPKEEIAKILHAERRALGEQYKNLTPQDMLDKIYARNIEKYGDKLGPSIEWLKGQGKSWDQIIDSATRTGGKDLGL
ncbi:MAG TPA: RHS repeat-associated core domain-containing protein, partial [Cellvibrio sp.]